MVFFYYHSAVFIIHPDVSFAHTSKTFGNTTVEIGWLSEPPLVSDLNSIVLQVSKGVSGNQTPVVECAFESFILCQIWNDDKTIRFSAIANDRWWI